MGAIATVAAAPQDLNAASLSEIVDLARYPIDALGSAGHVALLTAVRAELAETGASVLEGFLLPGIVAAILAEVDPLEPGAFVCQQPHNVYLVDADPQFAPEHPRNRLVRSEKAILAHDEIPLASPLRPLYEAPAFQSFLCQALDIDRLYPFDDPLASINVNFYGGDGQELGWHFDNAKFAVTLMLRQAPEGGAFEFAPHIRAESEAGYAAIGGILDGDRAMVRELKQDPGALVLFKGSRSLHRVAPSFGHPPRTIAILSYVDAPGGALKEHTRRLFYGRI
jgi:hypothetical protein